MRLGMEWLKGLWIDERKGDGRPCCLVSNRPCIRRSWTLDFQCRYCDMRLGEKAKGFGVWRRKYT